MDEKERYLCKGYDRSFDLDKQTQVASYIARKYEPKSPPNEDDGGNDDGCIKKGFRMAEYAMYAAIFGTNVVFSVSDALSSMLEPQQHSSSEEVEAEQVYNPEIISVNSSSSLSNVEKISPLIKISSSSSPRQTTSSMPVPTSPQPPTPASSAARSAKTIPRKKTFL